MLPSYINTGFDNPKKFKVVLHKFLYKTSFYSLDEFFNFKKVNSTYDLDRHTKNLACMFLPFIYLPTRTILLVGIYSQLQVLVILCNAVI